MVITKDSCKNKEQRALCQSSMGSKWKVQHLEELQQISTDDSSAKPYNGDVLTSHYTVNMWFYVHFAST